MHQWTNWILLQYLLCHDNHFELIWKWINILMQILIFYSPAFKLAITIYIMMKLILSWLSVLKYLLSLSFTHSPGINMKVRVCSNKFPCSWEAIKRQPCLLYIFHDIIYSRYEKLKDSSMLVNNIETSTPIHYLDCFLFYIFYKFNLRTVSKH